MMLMQRFLSFVLYALGVVFVAAFVHLVSVFAMPELAPHDAFARLAAHATRNQPFLLPQPLPGHELTPFEDPAMVEAACIFDLTQGSFHVRTTLDHDALLALSFRSYTGRVFYAMTDKVAVRGKIDIRVVTAAQLEIVQAGDDEDNPPQELRVVAPQAKGFVLIDALAGFPSERKEAEARALSVSCTPEAVVQN